jgi:hypothetical protein
MAQPTQAEAINKYALPCTEGGRGASTISEEFIDTQLEPSFEHLTINVDMNSQTLYNRFVYAVHKSKCRKSFVSGEVPNEIWRIMLEPQRTRPGYTPKWGLGHDGLFGVAPSFESMLKRLLATIYTTMCLPVAKVVNVCYNIPKKIDSCIVSENAMNCTRSMHSSCSFLQNFIKSVKNVSASPLLLIMRLGR